MAGLNAQGRKSGGRPLLSLASDAPRLQEAAFIARFQFECQRQGLTYRQVAQRIGVSAPTITYMVGGQRRVALALAMAVAEVIGVPLAEMIRVPDCATCSDLPPAGFKCLDCGREATPGRPFLISGADGKIGTRELDAEAAALAALPKYCSGCGKLIKHGRKGWHTEPGIDDASALCKLTASGFHEWGAE